MENVWKKVNRLVHEGLHRVELETDKKKLF